MRFREHEDAEDIIRELREEITAAITEEFREQLEKIMQDVTTLETAVSDLTAAVGTVQSASAAKDAAIAQADADLATAQTALVAAQANEVDPTKLSSLTDAVNAAVAALSTLGAVAAPAPVPAPAGPTIA